MTYKITYTDYFAVKCVLPYLIFFILLQWMDNGIHGNGKIRAPALWHVAMEHSSSLQREHATIPYQFMEARNALGNIPKQNNECACKLVQVHTNIIFLTSEHSFLNI